MVQHFSDLLGHKWNTPTENVHEIGKDIRMASIVKLLDVQSIIFKLNNGTLIIVNIAIVRSRENSYNYREILRTVPSVHLVTFDLCLVSSNHTKKVISLQELVCCVNSEEIRASSDLILLVKLFLFSFVMFNWI
jgi:hypothetical protein